MLFKTSYEIGILSKLMAIFFSFSDATTIFRGNTLVSKMMDEAMRLTGAAYLRSVLRPTLAAVLAERRPCEIDPARVKPSAAVTANLANLKDYVERVSTLPLRYESDMALDTKTIHFALVIPCHWCH